MPSRPVEIGDYRYFLSWQTRGVVGASNGTDIEGWVPQGGFWGKIAPLRGWTAYIAAESESGATSEIRLLTQAAIRAGDRLALDGSARVFRVVTAYRAMDPIDAVLVVNAAEIDSTTQGTT